MVVVVVSLRACCLGCLGGERDPVDITLVEIFKSSGRPLSGVVAGVVMTVWLGVAVVDVVEGGTDGPRAGDEGGWLSCWDSSEGPAGFCGWAMVFSHVNASDPSLTVSRSEPRASAVEDRCFCAKFELDAPPERLEAADLPRLAAPEILLIPNPYLSSLGLLE